MKTIFLTIVSFCFSAFAYTQETNTVVTDNPNAPEISFDKEAHDFGKIEKAGNGSCIFKFTNIGKEPLTLTNVKASCGCTTPYWPKEPIESGKSAEIKVKYDTNRIGKFSKTISVYSNAKTSMKRLKISGEVYDPYDAGAPIKEESPFSPKAQ
ncbi:MAG TPA: hypothetical protein DDX39_00590 [Bacteroidales bacterium]|nr:hypothetical protein [Bacteroidales bacterium]